MLEGKAILRRALFALPSSLLAIVYLHSFKHLSFTEVARFLNIPQSTVKTSFYRSLPRLRAALMKDGYLMDHFRESDDEKTIHASSHAS